LSVLQAVETVALRGYPSCLCKPVFMCSVDSTSQYNDSPEHYIEIKYGNKKAQKVNGILMD